MRITFLLDKALCLKGKNSDSKRKVVRSIYEIISILRHIIIMPVEEDTAVRKQPLKKHQDYFWCRMGDDIKFYVCNNIY